MAMKDTEMLRDRFVMRLPGEGGVSREVTILGRDLTYGKSGELTGGTVWSVTLVTSTPKSGPVTEHWAMTEGLSVPFLVKLGGPGFWNHVNKIDALLDRLFATYPMGDGGTGGGDEGGTGGGDEGGGDTGGGMGRTIVGTAKEDRLTGTDRSEKIYGKESDDRMRGRDGDDTMHGGTGDDRIRGDKGDDLLYGNAGHDRIRGDAGNDTIDGGSGDDRLRGDGGDDLLIDTAGNNRLRGGSGDDTLVTGSGRDVMIGGKGDDIIVSGGGRDFAMGQGGADVFAFCGDDRGEFRIRDFDAKEDAFDLCGIDSAAQEFAHFQKESRQVGDDIIWQHGGQTVVIEDTRRADITLKNFAGEAYDWA